MKRLEYYLANRQRFEAVLDRIKHLIKTTENPTTMVDNGHGQITIQQGACTAEEIIENARLVNRALPPEMAERLAESLNHTIRSEAAVELQGLVYMASMKDVVQRASHPGYNPQNDDEPLTLPYERGVYRRVDFTTQNDVFIKLTTTKLCFDMFPEGLEHFTFLIRPLNDELLEKCVRLLGGDMGETLLLLCGRFDDEADLNYRLNEQWLAYLETTEEDEVGELLGEVKQRALAAKEASKLHMLHGTDLPTVAKLDELRQLLDNLL